MRRSPYAVGITTVVLALGGIAAAARSERFRSLKDGVWRRVRQTLHSDQGVLVAGPG